MSITSLLILLIFSIIFLKALFDPLYGVVGYLLIYMLFNYYSWYWQPLLKIFFRPSLIAMGFLIIGSLLHIHTLTWKITRKEIEFYILLGLMCIASYIWGVGVHAGTTKILVKMAKMFLFIFFFLRIVNTMEKYNTVIWTFIVSAIFLAYQAHVSGDISTGRVDNIGGIDFAEANAFATFVLLAITFLGFKIFRMTWKKQIVSVLFIALMANGVILARSRGVLVGVACAIPYIFLKAPRKYRKHIYIYSILGAILFYNLMDDYFFERMGTIHSETKSGITSLKDNQSHLTTRIDVWVASISIFKDYPFGIGVNNFEKALPHYNPRFPELDAHNTYVLCYTEIGILGIMLFMIIIIETYFEMRRTGKMALNTPFDEVVNINVLSIGTVLIICLLGSMVTHSYLYLEILWIILALPICLEKATKSLIENEMKSSVDMSK